MPSAEETADLARKIEAKFAPHERGELFDRLAQERGREAATRIWMEACALLERKRAEPAGGAEPDVSPDAVRELYGEFEEAHLDEASSNDIVQLLDDWFTGHGYPTVIYRRRAARTKGAQSRARRAVAAALEAADWPNVD